MGQGRSQADPFGTARLRRGVLDAWAASPGRFREDANAEEDLALGGYRDRLVVELAQNAADAAARAQAPRAGSGSPCAGHGDSRRARRRQHRRPAGRRRASSPCRTLRASAKRDDQDGRPSAASASASPPCSP